MRLVCKSPPFWEQLRIRSTGTVQRRKRVSPGQLLAIPLLLPPLSEQRQIVDLALHFDNHIQGVAALGRAAWAAIGAILDRHDFESGKLGVDTPLSDLLLSTIGGVWGKDPGDDEVDVTVYRSTDFTSEGMLAGPGVRRSITVRQLGVRALRYGDVLLEKSGGGPKQPVGRVVWLPDDRANAVCANFVQLVRPDPARVVPRYLFLRMWNLHRTGRTLSFQTRTTGLRNLQTKEYLAQSVSLPESRQQLVLVDTIDGLIDLAGAAEGVYKAAIRSRAALIADLISGDHEIPDSYDQLLESAS